MTSSLLSAEKRFAPPRASTGFCAPCMLALIAGTDAAASTPTPPPSSTGPSYLPALAVIGGLGLAGFVLWGALNPPHGSEEYDPKGYRARRP